MPVARQKAPARLRSYELLPVCGVIVPARCGTNIPCPLAGRPIYARLLDEGVYPSKKNRQIFPANKKDVPMWNVINYT